MKLHSSQRPTTVKRYCSEASAVTIGTDTLAGPSVQAALKQSYMMLSCCTGQSANRSSLVSPNCDTEYRRGLIKRPTHFLLWYTRACRQNGWTDMCLQLSETLCSSNLFVALGSLCLQCTSLQFEQQILCTCQVSSPESKLSADPGSGGVVAAVSTAAATVKVSL